MIEFFKKQNELKNASLARRQFVLEAEEHTQSLIFLTSFVDYLIIISTVTKQKKRQLFKAREK